MWRYYVSLLREVPSALYEIAEAWLFWVSGAVFFVAWVKPSLWGLLPANHEFPHWLILGWLAALVVYVLLRTNYQHVVALKQKLAVHDSALDKATQRREAERRISEIYEFGVNIRTLIRDYPDSMSDVQAIRDFHNWRRMLKRDVTEVIGPSGDFCGRWTGLGVGVRGGTSP
jgi:hypothetical protein